MTIFLLIDDNGDSDNGKDITMTMHTTTTTMMATAMTDFKGGGDGFGDIHSDIDNDYFIVIIEILMDLTIIFSVPWFHLLI